MSAVLQWDGRPLSEVKEGDLVPVGEFSVLVRTHPSQVHLWISEKNLFFKKGKTGNRETKLLKVHSLAKMLPILKKCGMNDKKLAILEAEGYDTDKKNSKMSRAAIRAGTTRSKMVKRKKPGPKPQKNKPGPKPGPRADAKPKPGPRESSSLIGKYIEQAEKHNLGVKDYAAVIEEAIDVGIVVAI